MDTRTDVETVDLVTRGHAALEHGAWDEAERCFAAAAARHEDGDALDGLAWAVWWRGDGEAALETRKRAYRAYCEEGALRDAARVAGWLGTDSVDFRGELAVAQGWFRRARRLLEDDEPCTELGWLYVHEAEKQLLNGGDVEVARSLGAEASQLGRRFGDVDLEMMGLAIGGFASVMEGSLDEGAAELGEAATAALAGEFTERWAIYWCVCLLIHACELVRDHDRASQWCRGLREWSDRLGLEAFSRSCRVYYAGVLIWRGEWPEAETELVASAERLAEVRPPWTAEAWVRLGDLRRRQGRADEAADLFDRAFGHPMALLGVGELCLDRGDAAGARDRAHACLRDLPPDARAARAGALELLVRASAALGDLPGGDDALAELASLASPSSTDALRASAAFCTGLLASAKGAHEAARVALEDAVLLYQRSGVPFEQARARVALSHALAELGRREDAVSQAHAAARSFERMGARGEADVVAALLRQLGAALPDSPLTARELEVLRLVAAGGTNRAVADELIVSEHTVNRHVTNILTKLGVRTRSAAVAEAMRRGLL